MHSLTFHQNPMQKDPGSVIGVSIKSVIGRVFLSENQGFWKSSTRYDKLVFCFFSFVLPASIMILVT